MDLKLYAKAIVPVVVMGVLSLFSMVGIDEAMTVEQAVTLAVTSILVYAVPNKEA